MRLALRQRPQPAPAERARPARPEPAVDTALRVEEVPARRHHAHQLVAPGVLRQADGAAVRGLSLRRRQRARRPLVRGDRGGPERALDVAVVHRSAAPRDAPGKGDYDLDDKRRDEGHCGDLEREYGAGADAYIFLGSLRSSCLTVLDETLKVTATTQRDI